MSSMQIDQAPVFGRDSHVLDYWLANAEGFRVKRRGRWPARVQRVVREPDGMRASALVVSSALTRRRRVVDAYAVVSVDPAARRLVLDGSRRARLRRLVALGASASRRSAPRLAASSRGLLALGAAASRRSAPRVVAAVRRGHELDRAALALTVQGARRLRPHAAAAARATGAAAILWSSRTVAALGRALAWARGRLDERGLFAGGRPNT